MKRPSAAVEPAQHPGAAAIPDAPRFSPSEIEILQQLAERRQALEAREAELEQRAALLKATEARIDQKVQELKTIQATLERLIKTHDEQQDAKMQCCSFKALMA